MHIIFQGQIKWPGPVIPADTGMLVLHPPGQTSCDRPRPPQDVSSVLGESPGKITGVGCRVLLQQIFLTQGLNPGLLHYRQILYHYSHLGSVCVYIYIVMVNIFIIWP